ncbi:hypothetical protein [Nocardiopsis eucommiae]|uniref:hypothetical protein n=1 Tax=Nocardiopsis eucommiae TaxID=2831970 RepID=UPI003D746F54
MTAPKKTTTRKTTPKTDKPKVISFRGERFRLPELEGGSLDIDVIEAFEDGKVVTAVRSLLGMQQWATVKAMTPKPTMADLEDIADKIAKVYGMGSAGESDASSD